MSSAKAWCELGIAALISADSEVHFVIRPSLLPVTWITAIVGEPTYRSGRVFGGHYEHYERT